MKKIFILAATSAVAALSFCTLSLAQPETTVTITKTPPPPPPSGVKICYKPVHSTVTATRVINRCGPYGGCRKIRVSRDFDVITYKNCQIIKGAPCAPGYKTYGWYPNRMEARDALDRCVHTIKGDVPQEWEVNF